VPGNDLVLNKPWRFTPSRIKQRFILLPPVLSLYSTIAPEQRGEQPRSVTNHGYHLRHLGLSPPSHNNMRVEASIILGNKGRKKKVPFFDGLNL